MYISNSASTLQNKVIQFYHTECKAIRCDELPRRGGIKNTFCNIKKTVFDPRLVEDSK